MFVKKIILKKKQAQSAVIQQTVNFISAHKNEIIKKINNLKNYKLIFSAHGLPEKNIKKGDPYQWQVEQSVNKIIESLKIEKFGLDFKLSESCRSLKMDWTINRGYNC